MSAAHVLRRALAALLGVAGLAAPPPPKPRVALRTDMGLLVVELENAKAPRTAANFLKHVEARRYDGTAFHRTVTPANQPDHPVKIQVVQGGELPAGTPGVTPIPLEPTSTTGLRHEDGTLSMARDAPDTATTSFFICLGPQPELDFGGKRNPDGQGFAAFGRVVVGLDVVRKIQAAPVEGQTLVPPVKIHYATRVTGPDRVVLQHVLIAFQGSIPEPKVTRTREEARLLAERLLSEAKQGADFDALVKSHTDDAFPGVYAVANFDVTPDKGQGEGSRGRMVRSFGDVGFSLPVGGIALAPYDPAFSKYGWHLIKRLK